MGYLYAFRKYIFSHGLFLYYGIQAKQKSADNATLSYDTYIQVSKVPNTSKNTKDCVATINNARTLFANKY